MKKLNERLLDKEASLTVIGLGYVGMPLAVEFAKQFNVVGFDINTDKIDTYKRVWIPTTLSIKQGAWDTTVRSYNRGRKINDSMGEFVGQSIIKN